MVESGVLLMITGTTLLPRPGLAARQQNGRIKMAACGLAATRQLQIQIQNLRRLLLRTTLMRGQRKRRH
jgi:hypothetical protein